MWLSLNPLTTGFPDLAEIIAIYCAVVDSRLSHMNVTFGKDPCRCRKNRVSVTRFRRVAVKESA